MGCGSASGGGHDEGWVCSMWAAMACVSHEQRAGCRGLLPAVRSAAAGCVGARAAAGAGAARLAAAVGAAVSRYRKSIVHHQMALPLPAAPVVRRATRYASAVWVYPEPVGCSCAVLCGMCWSSWREQARRRWFFTFRDRLGVGRLRRGVRHRRVVRASWCRLHRTVWGIKSAMGCRAVQSV